MLERDAREARGGTIQSIYNLQEKALSQPIIFNDIDEIASMDENPLVITLSVGSCDVCRILIDIKSFVNLLFLLRILYIGTIS